MRSCRRRIVEWCARQGLAPIEICIVVLVLGVLASLIVPPFSTAAQESRDSAQRNSALHDTLQYVRTQITVFKAQHQGIAPGYPAGDIRQAPSAADFIAQLTEFSDQSCRLSAKPAPQFPLGKYLDAMPPDPLTGNAGVWVTDDPSPVADPARPFGWIYNPQTLDFRANAAGADSQGIAYVDY